MSLITTAIKFLPFLNKAKVHLVVIINGSLAYLSTQTCVRSSDPSQNSLQVTEGSQFPLPQPCSGDFPDAKPMELNKLTPTAGPVPDAQKRSEGTVMVSRIRLKRFSGFENQRGRNRFTKFSI